MCQRGYFKGNRCAWGGGGGGKYTGRKAGKHFEEITADGTDYTE